MAALPPATALAQVVAPARGIEVTAQAYQADYPDKMVFTLDARSSEEVVKATLRVKQVGLATVTANQLKFTPARSLSLRYEWDLRRYYVPPGVEIEYYWLLEDAAGQKLRTEPASFTLADERFAWRTLSDGPVQLSWYAGDERFAGELLAAGRRALAQLAGDAGVATDVPVKVFVYASQDDLLSALEPAAREWTGGQAFAEQGIVLIAAEPTGGGLDFGRRVLPHEISHVVVHRMTQNPYGDLPRWLDEGLAMYAEGRLDASYERALDRAIKENRLISVQSLSANFPSDPDAALLSYAQSYSLVKFIVDTYGPDRLASLLAIFREGATNDAALHQALGVDGRGLEAAWRAAVGAAAAPPERSLPGAEKPPTGSKANVWLLSAAVVGSAALAVSLLLARRRATPRQ